MIYVRPDVDITFTHPEVESVHRLGVYVRRDTLTYTTSYRKMGGHQLSGNLLKIPVWTFHALGYYVELSKHVSSTPLAGGDFPTHLISKTSEFNAENYPKLLQRLLNKPVDVTVKMDGASYTLIYRPNRPLMICSRNMILKKGDPIAKWFAERFPEKLGSEDYTLFAIQGELVGEKINGNMHQVTENRFFIFNVKEGSKLLNRDKMILRLYQLLPKFPSENVDLVPLVKVTAFTGLQALEACAEEQKYACGNLAEGIVLRDHDNYSASLKVINKGYGDEKRAVIEAVKGAKAKLKGEKKKKESLSTEW